MKHNNQSGVVEIVLAVIATALIVGIGAVAYVNYRDTHKSATVATSPSPTKESASNVTVGSAALATVKDLYDHYSGKQGDNVYVQRDLTQSLQNEHKNAQLFYDPILCAQNTPSKTTYDAPVALGKNFTIRVHTMYELSGDNPIDLTVDGSSNLISKITCNLKPVQ